MSRKIVVILAVLVSLGALAACNKKGSDQTAQLAELNAKMEAMQAELNKAKSGNAAPEEIARLEAAVAEIAAKEKEWKPSAELLEEQQKITERRMASSSSGATAPTTQTAAPQTASALKAQMTEAAKKQNFSDDDIKKTEKTMEKMMANASVQIAQLEAAQAQSANAAADPKNSGSAASKPEAASARAANQKERRETIQQWEAERRAKIEQETGMPYEEYARIETAKVYAQEAAEREAAVKIRLTKEQKDAMVAKGQGVLTVGWVTARPGGQATVSFNLVHPGLAAFSVHIDYDNRILRIDSEDEVRFGNGALRNVMFAFKKQFPQDISVPYKPVVYWASAANDYSVGELVTVRFTVLPDVTPTPRWADIKVSIFNNANQNLENVPITIEQGGITVR